MWRTFNSLTGHNLKVKRELLLRLFVSLESVANKTESGMKRRGLRAF